MSALYTSNSWFGRIVEGMTTNITGDIFLTYLLLIVILATAMIALWKIDFQWVAVSLVGIFLTLLAYSGDWLPFFGTLAILLAILVARYFIGDS